MRKSWQKKASLVFGAIIAAACSSDDVVPKGLAEGCVINTDCASPLVCAFQKCHVACNTSFDCQPGQRCVASDRPFHVCQLPEEQGCKLNSDCPERQVCAVDLQCRDQCAADRDCVKGQLCAGGTCAEPSELVDGVLKEAVTEAGAPSGHPCLYTSQCASPLVCRDHLCALECITEKDCPAQNTCVDNRCVLGSGTLIGPEGGVVSEASGKITITVPPNALPSPVSILLLPLEAFPEGALGSVFQIEPSGLHFDRSATLTYRYSATEIGATSPDDLRIAVARQTTWTPLASTVDATKGTVSASLEHLSVYGIIATPKVLSDAGGTVDATTVDATANVDVSTLDAGTTDATTVDAGSLDAAPVDTSIADAPPDVSAPVNASFEAAIDALADIMPADVSVVPIDASVDALADVGSVIPTDASNPCPSTIPTVVSGGADNVYGMAIDGADVYWTNRSGSVSSLLKAPLTGLPDGGAPPVLASSLDTYEAVFVDPSGVYFSANSADNIWLAPLNGVPDGGTATSLAPGQSSQPRAVFGFAGDLYWVNLTYSGAPSVRSVPMAGGAVKIIASFAAGTNLLGTALFVDATGVYFAAYGAGNTSVIYRAPLAGAADGGVPPTVATNLTQPEQLFGDGANLYFTDGLSTGLVRKAPIDGLQPATTLASAISYPGGVWVDASDVYFAAGLGPSARIVKVPKAGGVMTPLVCGQQQVLTIALSATDIYFAAGTSILSVPK